MKRFVFVFGLFLATLCLGQGMFVNLTPTQLGINSVTMPARLNAGVGPTLTPSSTAGTLPAATYVYVATALTPNFGETAPSGTASQALGAPGGVALTWTNIAGNQGYRIYRQDAASVPRLLTTTVKDATAFTDDGSLTLQAEVKAPVNDTSGAIPISPNNPISAAILTTDGVLAMSLFHTCTQTYTLYANIYDGADGRVPYQQYKLLTTVAPAGTNLYNVIEFGTELDPTVVGSGTAQDKMRFPQKFVQFFAANAGATAGICSFRATTSVH